MPLRNPFRRQDAALNLRDRAAGLRAILGKPGQQPTPIQEEGNTLVRDILDGWAAWGPVVNEDDDSTEGTATWPRHDPPSGGVGANPRIGLLLRFQNREKRGRQKRRKDDLQVRITPDEDRRELQAHEAVPTLWKAARRPHALGWRKAAEGQLSTSTSQLERELVRIVPVTEA